MLHPIPHQFVLVPLSHVTRQVPPPKTPPLDPGEDFPGRLALAGGALLLALPALAAGNWRLPLSGGGPRDPEPGALPPLGRLVGARGPATAGPVGPLVPPLRHVGSPPSRLHPL